MYDNEKTITGHFILVEHVLFPQPVGTFLWAAVCLVYLNPIVILLISDTGDYSIVICILSFSSYKYILETHYVDRIYVFMPDNLIYACIYNWGYEYSRAP